ncbi:MAG: type II secretion system protein [Armatimonadetes bacterium]|nr:type II secretion system protein [Armatimonadota bacterium]MDE2205272.1 type II secretion system protein [Armatimonadota bacterium]
MTAQRNNHNKSQSAAARGATAFTLIELLVVLALTAIVFTIVFKPLVDGFNLVSRAGTQIEAQTDARNILRQISGYTANAEYLYDNSTTRINLWFTDSTGAPYYISEPFAMMEYVNPARQGDENPSNQIIDPTTGQPIYPAGGPLSGFALPLSPGRSLGRIFIGLSDNSAQPDTHTLNPGDPTDVRQDGMPLKPYANRYSDPSLVNTSQDNRYTLYHAEVQAYIRDPDNANNYIPNLSLFHTVDALGNRDTKTGQLILHDPNFFYDNSLAGDSTSKGALKWAVPGWRDLNGDGKVEIWENWRAVSTSLMERRKVDMVALDRDDNNQIIYGALNRPTVRPLAQFAPSFVENDPGVPASLGAAGNEAPDAAAGAYTAQYDHWANNPLSLPYKVFVYRAPNSTTDPTTLNPETYFIANGNGKIVAGVGPPGSTPPDPNSPASIDVGPRPDPVTGVWNNPYPKFAFTVDPERGVINFAFPEGVLMHDASNNAVPQRYNPGTIDAALDGTYGRRYLDLHTFALALNPPAAISPVGEFNFVQGTLPTISIVPGSETVYGPDQRPGPHYGWRTEYSRVSANTGTVGPNQYKILYADAANAAADPQPNDPRVRIGYVEFDSTPDGAVSNINDNPINGVYKPHGLPTLKASGGVNVAADPVEVSYSFQMNRPNDVVKIDYYTRDLFNITLQTRYYDQASGTPQSVDLAERIHLRNLQH